MKTVLTVALMLLIFSAARAVPVTITLTDEEQRALYQILDAATKAGGLEQAKVTLYFLNKLTGASAPQAAAPAPAAGGGIAKPPGAPQ